MLYVNIIATILCVGILALGLTLLFICRKGSKYHDVKVFKFLTILDIIFAVLSTLFILNIIF